MAYNFSNNIRKPIYVVEKSKGIDSLGRYYLASDGIVVTGIVMYNIPRGMEEKHPFSWNPINGLHGHGYGLFLESVQTLYKTIVPVDGETLGDMTKSVQTVSHRYLDNCKDWNLIISGTFTDEMLESLRNKFKDAEDEASCLTEEQLKNIDIAFDTLKANKNKQTAKDLWIDKGYPCASRYGFAWKGASPEAITKAEALKMLDSCFEIRMEHFDGVKTLIIQNYSDSDLY